MEGRVKKRLLLIDTETGGLDATRHPILSLAALVLDCEGQVIDQMYTLIFDPRTMDAEESALKINGLSVEKIVAEGLYPAQAISRLVEMLRRHDMVCENTLVGHNVAFDAGFLKRLWDVAGATQESFDILFSHRKICTQSAALLLEQAGIINPGGSSLDALTKYFGISLDRASGHNALHDARATAELFECLLVRLREGV
jgi:DNA polymerase III epsilon subunit-like protein